MKQDKGFAEKVIHEALTSASGGLDLDRLTAVLQDAIEALQKQASALKNAHYDPSKPDALARSFHHTAKVLDETARLIEFAKGKPDSRTALSPSQDKDWIQVLTDDQLEQLMRWVDEHVAAAEAASEVEDSD